MFKDDPETREPFYTRARAGLIFVILAVALGSLAYRLLVSGKLEQTAMMFIGLPTLLALLLAMTPKARSATGAIMKGTTIALLLFGPLLGEGFICILMAAPIFYLTGLGIGIAIDRSRKHGNKTTLSCLVLVLLPMSVEGISPRLSFNRDETVQASRVVRASDRAVGRAMSRSPRLDSPLPLYGRMGFPRPTQAQGAGLEVGASRTIHFSGGEGHPGDLVMRIQESRTGYLRFAAVSDHSKLAHWLAWKSAEVEWRAVDLGRTQVTWTLHFRRLLDPAWYFRPWERYASRLAAEYLIQANAVPTDAERTE
jgi:hypothetical protein